MYDGAIISTVDGNAPTLSQSHLDDLAVKIGVPFVIKPWFDSLSVIPCYLARLHFSDPSMMFSESATEKRAHDFKNMLIVSIYVT